nr:RNA-directed DNA polymerase, eukaryota, reverse transcriptase zinc-binding domain protein [Tanacetum cinerariifolium]
MHVRVWVKADRKEFFCTFVYAHNRYTQRRLLLNNIRLHKLYVRDRPWCTLGDFNTSLFLHDYLVGNSNIDISMREFKECVEDLEILDVQYSGLQFTWTQKPKGNEGLLIKIDHVMANLKFNDVFAGSHAIFKPYRNSDHAPSMLCIPSIIKPKPKPFKFYNLITSNDNFKRVVLEGWSKYVSGFHMFRVTKKLKLLKKPLRKLLYEKGNLHTNVNQLRNDLD